VKLTTTSGRDGERGPWSPSRFSHGDDW